MSRGVLYTFCRVTGTDAVAIVVVVADVGFFVPGGGVP